MTQYFMTIRNFLGWKRSPNTLLNVSPHNTSARPEAQETAKRERGYTCAGGGAPDTAEQGEGKTESGTFGESHRAPAPSPR